MSKKLSLTDFVEVVSKAGTPKATKVREIKYRRPYAPATDFYRPLRAGLSRFHRLNRPRNCIRELLNEVTDPKKLLRYACAIDGYSKWMGRKQFSWFEPERGTYQFSGVDLIVNPELGLIFNGQKHLIKLYFKDQPLEKRQVDLITVAMAVAHEGQLDANVQMSVLDVNRAKLFNLAVPVASNRAMVNAELAYVATLWDSV